MGPSTVLILSMGAMGLCTIVGIYYVWVRKLPKSDDDSKGSQRSV
jgi:hypothetical protein